jgi:hypothetical protein
VLLQDALQITADGMVAGLDDGVLNVLDDARPQSGRRRISSAPGIFVVLAAHAEALSASRMCRRPVSFRVSMLPLPFDFVAD